MQWFVTLTHAPGFESCVTLFENAQTESCYTVDARMFNGTKFVDDGNIFNLSKKSSFLVSLIAQYNTIAHCRCSDASLMMTCDVYTSHDKAARHLHATLVFFR